MKAPRFCLLLALGILTVCSALVRAEEAPWKAGAARVDITPEEMTWMAGYAARKGPAEGVLLPVYARALALEDREGEALVMVTLDLIGVPRRVRDDVAEELESRYGIPSESLVLNASHTHCGPMIRLWRPRGGDEASEEIAYRSIPEDQHEMRRAQVRDYLDFLTKSVLQAVDEAMEALAPAWISWHRAKCGFAMNRRTPLNGSFQNAPNPDGLVDHEVPVLRVSLDEAGKDVKALLFGYACHATTLSIMEMNGDWPGFAAHYLEESYPEAVALFLNGCSGDQNPYPRRMHYYVERHGRSMATAVEAALETPAVKIEGEVQSALSWVEVPYARQPSRTELEERVASKDGYDQRHAEFLLKELDAKGELPASYPVPVQILALGDQLTFITMGGEVTVEYALRLKRELNHPADGAIWVAGYSNDVMGYVPSEQVLGEGGYEGESSMRFPRATVHPSTWAPGIEELLVGEILRLKADVEGR